MRVLVTGITGSVGSALTPRLLQDGHTVRGLSRRTATQLADSSVPSAVEMIRGDILEGEGLGSALAGIDVAYYLIHSMEAAPNDDFVVREAKAASNFAQAAADGGVRRIIYLGGLVPDGIAHPGRTAAVEDSETADESGKPVGEGSKPVDGNGTTPVGDHALSPHLRSRLEVERQLFAAVPDSTAFRASIVIGATSRSFRLLVRLIERMPVLVLPAWSERRTAPVDERDVVECLARVLDSGELSGRSVDIAGSETVTYGALIERIRDLMLVDRPVINLRHLTVTPIVSRLASLVADEEHELVGPLMEGLSADLLPRSPDAMELLSIRRHTLDAAIEHALREWESVEPLPGR